MSEGFPRLSLALGLAGAGLLWLLLAVWPIFVGPFMGLWGTIVGVIVTSAGSAFLGGGVIRIFAWALAGSTDDESSIRDLQGDGPSVIAAKLSQRRPRPLDSVEVQRSRQVRHRARPAQLRL